MAQLLGHRALFGYIPRSRPLGLVALAVLALAVAPLITIAGVAASAAVLSHDETRDARWLLQLAYISPVGSEGIPTGGAHLTGSRTAEVRRTLRSGDEVLIRPIRPDDKEGMLLAFERLSPDSRYRRFFSPTPSLGAAQLRYLTEVDHHMHEALLAIDPQTRDGLGVARFVRFPDDPTIAEVAVAVADDWHRRGLATALLHDLAARAREEGVKRFSASVLGDNAPAVNLFRHMGDAHESAADHGVVDLVMDVPDEGIPDALRQTVRAVAGGEVQHHPKG